MFVLGCLPPYKNVCVCLSVRVYILECIVCACKHASVLVCKRACVRAHVWVRLSVCLSDRTCVRSSMHAFVCLHARVREGQCLSPSVLPSVRSSMYAFVCMHACVRAYVWVRPSLCLSVCLSDRTWVRSSIHAFVCLHARVREGQCFSPSVLPSVCLSVRVHVRASKCLFSNACVYQCMRGISYF